MTIVLFPCIKITPRIFFFWNAEILPHVVLYHILMYWHSISPCCSLCDWISRCRRQVVGVSHKMSGRVKAFWLCQRGSRRVRGHGGQQPTFHPHIGFRQRGHPIARGRRGLGDGRERYGYLLQFLSKGIFIHFHTCIWFFKVLESTNDENLCLLTL
jgi:hypothetical protein